MKNYVYCNYWNEHIYILYVQLIRLINKDDTLGCSDKSNSNILNNRLHKNETIALFINIYI